MRPNKFLITGLVLLFLTAGFFWMRARGTGATPENTRIIHLYSKTIETFISTTGTVLPKNRLEVRPPVNGRVEELLVREGGMVKAGEIVAWMSSTDRAALLDAARGKGDEALAYWKDVYRSIPLVAPIDGQVIVATMQPGQTITAADAVIVLSDKLIFRAQVDETDIGGVAIGQAATATLDAYQDTKILAVVEHVYYESRTVNNVTIYDVDLKAEKLPDFCRSGMNVTVELRDEYKENIPTLPVDAVQTDKEGSYVMVKVPETPQPIRRPVKTGITDDAFIEIVSGITPQDEVVVKDRKFTLPKKSTGTNPFAPARPAGGGRH